MKELSYHVLDIANNSVRANAKEIVIKIIENSEKNILTICIKDNGSGMKQEMLKDILNPFTTSRTLRKVGLGLPLLNDTCTMCNGTLSITSQIGVGTNVEASMELEHIDRPPMGDIASTMTTLITSNEKINVIYYHEKDKKIVDISTADIKEVLGDVPLAMPQVSKWLRNHIMEELT